jgi:hypothetical protein
LSGTTFSFRGRLNRVVPFLDIIRSMIETSLFALAVAVPFVCVVGGLLFLTITGLARYRTR